MTSQTNTRDRFERHDLADFAQEFLIRNPNYRDQFCALKDIPSGTRHMSFAHQWGLEFRCAGGSRRDAISGNMANTGSGIRRLCFRCASLRFHSPADHW
ncbi:MAG: hypothetical protein JJ901_03620 [Erythrobacter sp.]|uniref:transcriptional regulator domain-containing protein n=1 Tax=Erythrobacter sp. TaxID=1042 RepID=UPI001B293018|nr:DUF6499 domain-containing protein [Erythrobacter sp.]MBO6767379.1 hypothetical protein [Erythrobacter sp.]